VAYTYIAGDRHIVAEEGAGGTVARTPASRL
jgi:hypothetical protein